MDFKQLKSLVEVVECRSFTKAAERLYISQPTVSAHIRQLEEELQSRLVIRTTKSIEITPRGLEAYDCARSILELRENLLRRWADDGEQMIQLGASTIPSAYILPELSLIHIFFTAKAVSMSCSLDSTAQGPAITVRWPGPICVFPTGITESSG